MKRYFDTGYTTVDTLEGPVKVKKNLLKYLKWVSKKEITDHKPEFDIEYVQAEPYTYDGAYVYKFGLNYGDLFVEFTILDFIDKYKLSGFTFQHL